MRESNAADLAEREAAEANLEAAKRTEAKAKRLAKAPTGLRTSYEPVLVDLNAAIQHYWAKHREEFTALIERLAVLDVRCGIREIPGFKIEERKVAQ